MVCDQCSERHRKCFRERPVCSRCKKFGLNCTWTKLQSNRTERVYDKVFIVLQQPKCVRPRTKKTIKPKEANPILNPGHKNNGYSSYKNQLINYKPETNIFVEGSSLYYNPSLWDWTARKWNCKVAFRIAFSSFIKTCGISSLMAKPEQEIICKIFLYKCKISLNSTVYFDKTTSLHSSLLIRSATASFFQNYNSLYPLFTLQGFISKPRSYLLRLAVCNIGLRFLPPSALRDALIKNTDNEITERLLPSRLSFTLDTVQTIMVYKIETNWKEANPYVFSYLRIAAIIIKSLGINQSRPSCCSQEYQFELELAHREINRINQYYFLHGTSYFERQYLRTPSILKLRLSEQEISVKLGWYAARRNMPNLKQLNPMLGIYEEVLFLIDTEATNFAISMIRHTSFVISTKLDLNYQQVAELVLSCEENVKANYIDTLRKISRLCGFFVEKLTEKFARNSKITQYITHCTLMAMRIWVTTTIRAYCCLLRINDFMPIPKIAGSKSSDIFFSKTQSRLIYCKELLYTLEKVDPEQFFVNFHSNILMSISRILLNQLDFLANYLGPTNSSLKPYVKCLELSVTLLKELSQFHIHSYFANAYLQVLKLLLTKYPSLSLVLINIQKLPFD